MRRTAKTPEAVAKMHASFAQMTASLAEPAEILGEVFRGTGASFTAEVDRSERAPRDAGVETLLGVQASARAAPLHDSWRLLLGVSCLAGGAFLIALGSLIVSNQSMEQSAAFRRATQDLDSRLGELPGLKSRVEDISAELNQARTVQKPLVEAARQAVEASKALAFEVQQSIETVNHKLDGAIDAVAAQEGDLSLRLGRVEASQTAQAGALDSLRLRMATSDPVFQKASFFGAHPLAAFRLKSVRRGVATVAGPEGVALVSVGDTLFDLGTVLKVGNRGRRSVVVTEQGTLTSFAPRFMKRRPVASAL